MKLPSNKPVIVGVMGTHSTGKSTFIARLTLELRRHSVQVSTVVDLGERAQQLGLPILHNHTWVSTMWFITHGISQEMAQWPHADVVVVDRAVPDALGYYRAALAYRSEQPDPALTAHLETIVRGHSHVYDLLYRTTLDETIPLGTDKPRDDNSTFRELADQHVAGVLRDLDIPHHLLRANQHDQAVADSFDFILDRLAEDVAMATHAADRPEPAGPA